jgi:peptidoglycan/xylan/chitin deacetylase (PgdA/CDA1 family)
MAESCKIIMYHYVRDIKNSKFPGIKGLEKSELINQIEFLKKKFHVITIEEIIEYIYENRELPSNSVLLTFDDGLKDHFHNVFPILKQYEIKGSFFIPIKPIEEKKVLDVHKIHLILAKIRDFNIIINEIKKHISQNKRLYNLRSFQEYYQSFSLFSRYDPKEIIFIKRMLQRELPEQLRIKIVDELFRRFVINDEVDFAEKFYVNLEEMKEMTESGMYIGSHGYSHKWFTKLSNIELEKEVSLCVKFAKKNCGNNDLVMCYPYGGHTASIANLIKKMGYKLGLTTNVGDANLSEDNAFTLERFDTNDFPK